MLAGFFSKPLQVQRFKRFRYLIMGYTPIPYFIGNVHSRIKEQVGNSEQNEVIEDSIFLSFIMIKSIKALQFLIIGHLRLF